MPKKLIPTLLVVLLALFMVPLPARADGIIIPDPPICDPCPPPPCPGPWPCPIPTPMVQLAIRYHKVTVTIDNQVATTHVDQVFFNPNEWTVEGTYIFPLPQDAAVSSFTLWVDGEPVEGEILDADSARTKYHEIVSQMRDPALLEYAGRGAVQAHIFPIPPQAERRVELEYSQVLAAENGLVRYIYPLSTEKYSLWPLENVSINVEVRSDTPIRAAYSPSHAVAVSREAEGHILAGYEDQNILPDTDFALYYSLGESEAIHLLTYRDPTDPQDSDGFFLLLLAPDPGAEERPVPKDVLLVLDRSGSMEGQKFIQAQEALRFILNHLNPGDRFNIVVFSTGLETYAPELRPAEEADQATAWVDGLSAAGSTDINRALLEAAGMMKDGSTPGRPAYLIFLTDGLPTEGVVDSQAILYNLKKSAPESLRLFAFGVGYDVDTFLLDSLAQEHHGATTYVLPDERLDEILSAFYAKVSTPVLTDLSLDFGEMAVYDLYPAPLPDLFKGSQIVLLGRYKKGGQATIVLEGLVNGRKQTFSFPDQEFSESSLPGQQLEAIPRLWATRKIGYLLNQIRLEGPDEETVDQIVRLSIRFGIVTPYTSYLVTEPMPLGAAEQERIAADQFKNMQGSQAPSFGQAAVEAAAGQGELAQAEALDSDRAALGNTVRIAGARTFVLTGKQWVDTAYDPNTMAAVKVAFLSKDYFALADSDPDLATAFALGEQVIVISGSTVYQVVPSGSPSDPVTILSSPRPSSTAAPVAQVHTPTSIQPSATPAPQPAGRAFPCSAGLAPLLLLLVALMLPRRR